MVMRAQAQQTGLPVIGWVGAGSPATLLPRNMDAFNKSLNEAGYVEGRNLAIEYRWAETRFDRMPAIMADLVARRVNVIAAMGGSTAALAAKAATTTIPVVFNVGVDPVRTGLVASLGRPGGNLTGVTTLGAEAAAKRLELLHELLPGMKRAALLVNPAFPALAQIVIAETQAAAHVLSLDIVVLYASSDAELNEVFANLARAQTDGLIIGTDSFFTNRTRALGQLVLQHRVPAIYEHPEYAASGGLMSYGADLADQFRQAGVLIGRILKGEKPGDLPVQQAFPRQFEFPCRRRSIPTISRNRTYSV
jgi:putative ABC transport system substrate-binding protein